MLTPVEIQNRVFKSGGLGYDKKEVDSFIKEIVESYELLYRERVELMDKVNVLNEGIQNYKTIEKTMQKALILAQKTAEETQEAALKKAHAIEKEAMTKAELLVGDARREFELVHQKTIQLLQQYEKYKLQFKNLAATQIELLETESFQISMMETPKFEVEQEQEQPNSYTEPEPNLETVELEAPVEEEPKQELPKFNINFTNVASDFT